ncbi:MAG: hypothetical protein EBY32_20185, partial [Proteobacteria bacterium]|nr:hypothetical protein [Pseudomonadota bacterium]
MSEDEPIIQFSSKETPDYVAIAAAISCVAGGRKKRGGVIGKMTASERFDAREREAAAAAEAAKRQKMESKVGVFDAPAPASPMPMVPGPVDPNTQKIADGLKMIDDGIREKAGAVVKENLWTIMGIGAATGAAACVAPQLALLPPIAAMMALYSPSLAASIRTPGGVTVSQLDSLVRSAKTKAAIEVEKQIATAKKDQKNQSAKITGVLDRLSELTAKKDKIVALFDKLSKIADRASTVKKPDETIALIEETKAAVESAPEPEPAAPAPAAPVPMDTTAGSRRRRASGPKRTRRSSSARRRRY